VEGWRRISRPRSRILIAGNQVSAAWAFHESTEKPAVYSLTIGRRQLSISGEQDQAEQDQVKEATHGTARRWKAKSEKTPITRPLTAAAPERIGRAASHRSPTPTIENSQEAFMAATAIAVATMKVAQVSGPGGDFQIVERKIPTPGAGEVRIKVQACGVCHSDALTKEGAWPGIQYPRVPGHEVAGIIDEVGESVTAWKKGQRVGVGWHGGQDNTCLSCRRGDFRNCRNVLIPGISYDGGYQQYMVAPVGALAAIPESLSDVEAAPLLCAGITTFNALRHSGALPSDLVAIQGIGGLGHLGIQFASKFGYKVAAIGRGPENAALAKKLGANVYIDSKATNAAEELQKLGGAQVILATAPSSKSMSELIDGLGPNGKLMVIGAAFEPIEVTPVQLIMGSKTIQGWAAGTPTDSEDTLRFAELTGVRPMIETYPLEEAAEAYARMMSGKAQFRVVITM
jgi:D-arabinose 1-dehydrogenase-like Zn-dependent alcohol dehydrogenase